MRVVVTGGAGYVGGFAAERLLELGHEVTVFDNLWRGHAAGVPKGADFIEVDLRDAEGVMRAVRKAAPEAVMHFAAATLVGESMGHPRSYFGVNVVGTHNLIFAMVEAGCSKFVFSSTAAVYGVPERIPILEDDPKKPINPYGQSKWIVEQMLPWHAEAYGLNYACMRYFNVAGGASHRGEDHDPETHLVPILLEAAAGKRDEFTIFGEDYNTFDGTNIRDYVEVHDLVEAHVLALDKLDKPLGAFNLGTKTGFSVKQVLEAARNLTDQPIPARVGPRRAGDPPVLVADSTRARTELGWNPVRSDLETMLNGAWEWLQNNPNGYRK
ncbi:MAG: UDP-glucose 4-epimerase GalE [Thermomicrobiales bacterium]|nr:UDP-glucose 4-epimerase GalE [Thermomicrobiales bacterium]